MTVRYRSVKKRRKRRKRKSASAQQSGSYSSLLWYAWWHLSRSGPICIKEYIAEDNEEMAVKTIQEIYARIENIQQFPYMGADLAKRVSFRTDYKYVICGNYVVLYKIGEEYVEIYRVVNRYQDITKIFI